MNKIDSNAYVAHYICALVPLLLYLSFYLECHGGHYGGCGDLTGFIIAPILAIFFIIFYCCGAILSCYSEKIFFKIISLLPLFALLFYVMGYGKLMTFMLYAYSFITIGYPITEIMIFCIKKR